jgi:hypothetical protein
MMRPVVANEERKDQRKRVWQQYRCQTDAPFEEDAGGAEVVRNSVGKLGQRG